MGQVRVIKNNPNLAPFLVTQEQCEEHGAAFFFKQWGGWGADGKNVPRKITGEFSPVKLGIKCLLRFEI